MLLAFELSDHAQVHTAGLPGFLTRFREATADAHVQEIICAKVYKPERQPVNSGVIAMVAVSFVFCAALARPPDGCCLAACGLEARPSRGGVRLRWSLGQATSYGEISP